MSTNSHSDVLQIFLLRCRKQVWTFRFFLAFLTPKCKKYQLFHYSKNSQQIFFLSSFSSNNFLFSYFCMCNGFLEYFQSTFIIFRIGQRSSVLNFSSMISTFFWSMLQVLAIQTVLNWKYWLKTFWYNRKVLSCPSRIFGLTFFIISKVCLSRYWDLSQKIYNGIVGTSNFNQYEILESIRVIVDPWACSVNNSIQTFLLKILTFAMSRF